MKTEQKTALVTGGGGYLGSVLTPMLLSSGYKVVVLDRFFWGKKTLSSVSNRDDLCLVEADTRFFPKKYLKGVDVVIDLASLSNDPIGELNPEITMAINFEARAKTAKLAKEAGVGRYILASSCSVYGFREEVLSEKSNISPVTTYARASALAEEAALKLNDKNFLVTVLRQGTLYGISPRMRFDLVLNTMALSYFKNKRISVLGGDQWRPILHVKDSAKAFIQVAGEDAKKISGQIFNVGDNKHNYQIKELAKLVAGTKGKIITEDAQRDFRSYRVSFDKIKKELGFTATENPKKTAGSIIKSLKNKKIQDSIETRTVDWYKHLISKNPKILEARKC